MKKVINFIIATIVCTGTLFGQLCTNDPSITDGEIDPAPLVNGGGGTLSLTYTENLEDYNDEENDPVSVTICLLNIRPEDGVNSVAGTFADHFDWIYSENLNCYQGTQNQNIMGGSGGTFTVDFVQETAIACPDNQMGFNANIQPAACMNGTNDAEDDSVSAYTCNTVQETAQLSISDYVFREDAGVVEVEVCLSATVDEDVEVSYNMSDGTASLGEDFSALFAGTLTIPAGERCTIIEITIVDDLDVESTESFTINLFNPTNAEIGDSTGVVQIEDNDVLCEANAPTLIKN